ncbi:MAG TPA: hypothetical protein VEU78_02035 [Steroidobacteraceae bacterium]|jgi:hypothetical protein|nr:hypothetical protein [Steroidobacteraceae bacterium]
MNALRQLGFLKLNLRPNAPSDEEHRVLALFRNRAELKKAYGGLQEETYRLKDLVKQQEAATQRVQELLNTLEGRLGVPETAYSALVFYQLRRLWQSGRELLGQFVGDLSRQQDERERRSHLALFNRRQMARRQTCESQLHAAEALSAQAAAEVAALEAGRSKLTRLWHYFRRRALERRLGGARASEAAARAAVAQAQAELEAVSQEPLPEFPGLSLSARRSINVAAIAYAEVLCARLEVIPEPLLNLAREATAQRASTDAYGSPQECVLLMAQIQRAQRLLGSREALAEEIKGRTRRLKSTARYRGAADTCPTSDSVAPTEGDALATAAQGRSGARVPNVLAEDTWDLFRVLLR